MSVIRAWQATLYGHPDFPVGPFDEHQHDVAVLPWPEWEAQQARNYFLEQELATAQQRIRELGGRLEAALHGVPAQAEIDRLKQEVERLRNRLEVCLRG